MTTLYAWLYPNLPLFIVGLFVLGLYAFLKSYKPAKDGNPLPLPVVTLTGVAGALAAFVSMSFSYAFGVSLGDTLFMQVAMVALLFSWQIAEFTAAFWFGYALQSLSVGKTIVAVVLFAGGIAINWTAGQSFLSARVDQIETQRLKESDSYQMALAQRQQAADKAQSLAVSDNTAIDARARLAQLENELQTFLNSPAKNSGGIAVGTVASVIGRYGCNGYYSGYCAERDRIENQMHEYRLVLDQFTAYQGAKSHADNLAAGELPTGAKSATLPGIQNLATTLNQPVEKVRAYFNSVLGAACEVAALAMLWLFGSFIAQLKNGQTGNSIPPAQVRKNEPVPALDVGGLILTDGLAHLHAGEVVIPAHEVAAYELWKSTRQASPKTETKIERETIYKTVGKTKPCEHCGEPFAVTRSNKKYCSDKCRADAWEKRTGKTLKRKTGKRNNE